jgi:hypothetical protein
MTCLEKKSEKCQEGLGLSTYLCLHRGGAVQKALAQGPAQPSSPTCLLDGSLDWPSHGWAKQSHFKSHCTMSWGRMGSPYFSKFLVMNIKYPARGAGVLRSVQHTATLL